MLNNTCKEYSNPENAIICGKTCDMRIFAKYAKYAAIACSLQTGIPNCIVHCSTVSAL